MRTELRERRPAFVLVSSAISAGAVWYAVVRGIGYAPMTGLGYAAAYFLAMLLFLDAFGFTLRRGGR
ncbi:MAG: hypothetical protein PHN82_12300 [bacterium]|nr:hypothetical protein [bacterium]